MRTKHNALKISIKNSWFKNSNLMTSSQSLIKVVNRWFLTINLRIWLTFSIKSKSCWNASSRKSWSITKKHNSINSSWVRLLMTWVSLNSRISNWKKEIRSWTSWLNKLRRSRKLSRLRLMMKKMWLKVLMRKRALQWNMKKNSNLKSKKTSAEERASWPIQMITCSSSWLKRNQSWQKQDPSI